MSIVAELPENLELSKLLKNSITKSWKQGKLISLT